MSSIKEALARLQRGGWLKEPKKAKSKHGREISKKVRQRRKELERKRKVERRKLNAEWRRFHERENSLVDRWHELQMDGLMEDVRRGFHPESELSGESPEKVEINRELLERYTEPPKSGPRLKRSIIDTKLHSWHQRVSVNPNVEVLRTKKVVTATHSTVEMNEEKLHFQYRVISGELKIDELQGISDAQDLMKSVILGYYESSDDGE